MSIAYDMYTLMNWSETLLVESIFRVSTSCNSRSHIQLRHIWDPSCIYFYNDDILRRVWNFVNSIPNPYLFLNRAYYTFDVNNRSLLALCEEIYMFENQLFLFDYIRQ